jgi:hypothetical protein
MDEGPEKASMPAQILKRARAIDLYLVAVWALAIVAALATFGCLLLASLGREESNQLATLGSTALVGLVAMLRAGDGQQG